MIETINDIEEKITDEVNRLLGASLYKKLNIAIESKNEQSVWALSKIITRYQM